MLTTNVSFEIDHIGGPVLIYLNDGNVVSLSNRVSSDNADEESRALYSLSQSNINALKASDIRQIRFSVVRFDTKTSYTAENLGRESEVPLAPGISITKRLPYQTAKEVSSLFNGE
jgi:hypothetical protein